MLKKILCLILSIVVSFMTGCSLKEERTYIISSPYYYNVTETHVDYSLCEPANSYIREVFTLIGELEVKILNETYKDLNLNFDTELPIYETEDVSKAIYGKSRDDIILNGHYSIEENIIVINKNILDNKAKVMAVLAHEIIHYIYANNNDTTNFFTLKKDGKETGDALIEGLTHKITVDILATLSTQFPSVNEVYSVALDSYPDLLYFANLLSIVIPDSTYYYLSNNITALKNEFDNLSCDGYFEIFLGNLEHIRCFSNIEENTQSAIELLAIAYSKTPKETKFIDYINQLGTMSDSIMTPEYYKHIEKIK